MKHMEKYAKEMTKQSVKLAEANQKADDFLVSLLPR